MFTFNTVKISSSDKFVQILVESSHNFHCIIAINIHTFNSTLRPGKEKTQPVPKNLPLHKKNAEKK